MNTLYLKFHGPTTQYKDGLYEPEGEINMSIFKHFSGGMIKMAYGGLSDLIEVAEPHGWEVVIKREAGE